MQRIAVAGEAVGERLVFPGGVSDFVVCRAIGVFDFDVRAPIATPATLAAAEQAHGGLQQWFAGCCIGGCGFVFEDGG